jgi:hypothetical protein
MNNNEKIPFSKENLPTQDLELTPRYEKVVSSEQNLHEKSPEEKNNELENIRNEVETVAHEQESSQERISEVVPHPSIERGPITKTDREASFNATLHEAQSQMSPIGRTFSKVIHNKLIERSSEITGATIARPNALLAGSFCAFILTLAVYIVAKNIGYPLSGFETIGAFIIGWIIGQLFDFFKTMITGQR